MAQSLELFFQAPNIISIHLVPYLKGDCMNKKQVKYRKPHLGLCRLVWEELGDKTKTKDLHIT